MATKPNPTLGILHASGVPELTEMVVFRNSRGNQGLFVNFAASDRLEFPHNDETISQLLRNHFAKVAKPFHGFGETHAGNLRPDSRAVARQEAQWRAPWGPHSDGRPRASAGGDGRNRGSPCLTRYAAGVSLAREHQSQFLGS